MYKEVIYGAIYIKIYKLEKQWESVYYIFTTLVTHRCKQRFYFERKKSISFILMSTGIDKNTSLEEQAMWDTFE